MNPVERIWQNLKDHYDNWPHEEANYFFPEDGQHPSYSIEISQFSFNEAPLITFVFQICPTEHIQYQLLITSENSVSVAPFKIIEITYHSNNYTDYAQITFDSHAKEFFDKYFEEEVMLLLKDLKEKLQL